MASHAHTWEESSLNGGLTGFQVDLSTRGAVVISLRLCYTSLVAPDLEVCPTS